MKNDDKQNDSGEWNDTGEWKDGDIKMQKEIPTKVIPLQGYDYASSLNSLMTDERFAGGDNMIIKFNIDSNMVNGVRGLVSLPNWNVEIQERYLKKCVINEINQTEVKYTVGDQNIKGNEENYQTLRHQYFIMQLDRYT